ncbi:odorant receptor Or1-like [Anopheles bellator]|uniref:odorant receptor Or1-like n=1 Tax=Anopheles bellator TaxID=139047 RepID=UPI00264857A2|nr:odorant receptor Or1-like [Anopheles bellator]
MSRMSLRLAVWVFRLYFAWPSQDMDRAAKSLYRLKGLIFRILVIYLSVATQTVYVFTVTNQEELLASLCLLLTQVVMIFKMEFFYRKSAEIQRIVYQFQDDQYVPRNEEEAQPLKLVRKSSTIIWLVYLLTSDGLIVAWTIAASLLGEIVFPAWYPFDYKSSNGLYLLTLVSQCVAVICSALFNVSCDSLFALLLGLTDAHLRRLVIQLEKVGHRQTTEVPVTWRARDVNQRMESFSNQSSTESYEELLQCIVFHQNVTGTLKDILNLFGTPVLLQLFCSVFILCITGLHLVADEHTIEEFIFVMLYLLCLITQVFSHCYFGNEITYTSKRVHQATSFVNYPDMDIRTRKLLIMFQNRTVTELKCFAKAVLHIELSMATFVTIIKSSYSFLTVLQSMTE